jgi:5-methylcytosine-specific restriction protein A
MWARDANRCRWSVAFPIIESYDIENRPDAADVFGPADYRRLFAHPSTLLRPLSDEDRAKLAALLITSRPALNAWVGIEDEAVMAAGSEISEKLQRDIDRDLAASAMEGLTEEQRSKVRRRAAWLADRFLKQRRRTGTLTCDECAFDPATRVAGTRIQPRTLLDVHHRNPLAEGQRYTTTLDFELLCPTCHRFKHAVMRLS